MINLTRHDCYRAVVRGAVTCDRAAGGVWLELSRDSHSFLIEVHHGLTPEMLAFVALLRPGDGSASGSGVVEHHRVVIRDVAEDYHGKHKAAALAAGIRAVTATPLIDSRSHAFGVITLYHATPHHPSYTASQQLDACCHVATQVHEVFDRGGAGANTLSPAGRTAAETVERLLPNSGFTRSNGSVYKTLSRHLDILLRELQPCTVPR